MNCGRAVPATVPSGAGWQHGDHLDFQQKPVTREPTDLYCRRRRRSVLAHVAVAYLAEDWDVCCYIGKVGVELNDVLEAAAHGSERGLQILEHLRRLCAEIA